MPTITVPRHNFDADDQLTEVAGVSVGAPEPPPTTCSGRKRAVHAAVTDRYGRPGL